MILKDNLSDPDRFGSQEVLLAWERSFAVDEYRDLLLLPDFTWPWEQVLPKKSLRGGYLHWFSYLNVNELLQEVIFRAASAGKDSGQAVREFAGRTYAHCLLAQVYHHYFFRKSATLPGPKASILFPEIDGVITFSRVHVCPAVLPAMLLYFNPSMLFPRKAPDNDTRCSRPTISYAPRYVGLEADTWKAHEALFDEYVDKDSQAVIGYVYHLCDLPFGFPPDLKIDVNSFVTKITSKYFEEHCSLKAKVMRGSDEGRLVNRWTHAYPDSRERR